MKICIAFAAIILNSATAFADESVATAATQYKIKQVISAQNLVVVETSNPTEELTSGKTFLVTFPNEKQCSLSLKEQKGHLLSLSSSSCENASEITRNLPIEVALVDSQAIPQQLPVQTAEQKNPTIINKDWGTRHFGVSLHYSVANEVRFNKAFVTTTTSSGNVEAVFRTDNGVGLGVTYARMETNSWGFLGNLIYEPGREISSVKFTGSGGTATANFTNSPRVSFLITEANAVYRWNTFYLPFGINVCAPALHDTQGSIVSVSSGFGVFLGGGLLINESSSLELFIRSLGLRMTETSDAGSIDYDLGTMAGLGFGYKYWF